jgi:hypothetical protein
MQKLHVADFYHGWIIEVAHENGLFTTACYSPSRERFIDYSTHPSDIHALRAAKQGINRYLACHALSSFCRELYELGQLPFEEWRSLQNSLTEIKT